jgi:hypothetical protein
MSLKAAVRADGEHSESPEIERNACPPNGWGLTRRRGKKIEGETSLSFIF